MQNTPRHSPNAPSRATQSPLVLGLQRNSSEDAGFTLPKSGRHQSYPRAAAHSGPLQSVQFRAKLVSSLHCNGCPLCRKRSSVVVLKSTSFPIRSRPGAPRALRWPAASPSRQRYRRAGARHQACVPVFAGRATFTRLTVGARCGRAGASRFLPIASRAEPASASRCPH